MLPWAAGEGDYLATVQFAIGEAARLAAGGATIASVRAGAVQALRAACAGPWSLQRSRTMDWLWWYFGLTPEDIRARNHEIIRDAAALGRLRTVQWAAAAGAYAAADIRADNNELLYLACSRGHLRVARWLADEFGLTAADARAANSRAFCQAAEHNRLRELRWLVERFGFTVADRAAAVEALYLACTSGHLRIARWLVRRFGLVAADAAQCGVWRPGGAGPAPAPPAIAAWLAAEFAADPGAPVCV